MKKIDTIVVAPHFYTMEGAGVGYHSDAAMAVDGGKILKVGNRAEILAEYTAEEMITLDHHMVLPGFIDGHMHTACNIMRGLAQDTNSWMMFGLQPFDNAEYLVIGFALRQRIGQFHIQRLGLEKEFAASFYVPQAIQVDAIFDIAQAVAQELIQITRDLTRITGNIAHAFFVTV